MMIIKIIELKKSRDLSLESHQKVTRMSINNNVNNDNNVNNIRSTDIKVLKDAYVKNERLHQLTYNNRTLKIRLFKLTLRGFLYFDVIICVFKFLAR